MGKKLYKTDSDGGWGFNEHKEGFIQTANYIYDLWLPLLGYGAIAVYGLYCRLARDHCVKAISQKRIAKGLRMGRDKLRAINDQLEECGFIKIRKPEGYEVAMHWSISVDVLDPPREISPELIEKYAHPSGYEIIPHWLAEEEICDNTTSPMTQIGQPSDDPNRSRLDPNRSSKNEYLIEDSETENLIKECADAREFFESVKNKASKDVTVEDIQKELKRKERIRDALDPNLPLDWAVAQSKVVTADKRLVEKAKEEDERKQNARMDERERYIRNLRSWIYPPYTELGVEFFKATGIKPVGTSEKKMWIKALDTLYSKGIQPIDIRLGVKRMIEKSLIIKNPFSVQTYALRMKNLREKDERTIPSF